MLCPLMSLVHNSTTQHTTKEDVRCICVRNECAWWEKEIECCSITGIMKILCTPKIKCVDREA